MEELNRLSVKAVGRSLECREQRSSAEYTSDLIEFST